MNQNNSASVCPGSGGSGAQIKKEANPSNRQFFTYILYAVTFCAALTKISISNSLSVNLCHLLLIFVLLEDFYWFYKVVCAAVSSKPYTAKSLTFESLILLSWYYAFISLPDNIPIYAFLLSAFYAFKILAGLSAYKGNMEPIMNELFFIFPTMSFIAITCFHEASKLPYLLCIQAASVAFSTFLCWLYKKKKNT